MALTYWGIAKSQAEIAVQIKHIEGAGTPSQNIMYLVAFGVEITEITV